MMWDDALTVAAIRSGDRDAFTAIVERYQAQLARYLYRLVGNEQTALDLAQDTFLEAYRSLHTLRSDLALRAWLFRIATNRAIEVHRRRRRIQWLPLLGGAQAREAPGPTPEEACGEHDLVMQALRRLPRDHAACLILHHHEGFTYGDVAAIVGISSEATRKRIARARDQFKVIYGQLTEEAPR